MKRLAFCFDGTWNRLDARQPTNVQITAESILDTSSGGITQIVYYDDGVGTNGADSLTGGLFGTGLLRNISDAYRFLILNYVAGDQIFIFGFSRGAFTARSLVGLLSTCGLISHHHAGRIDEAIAHYRRRDGSETFAEEMRRFRADVSPHLCISEAEVAWRAEHSAGADGPSGWPKLDVAYLGVWDTVGALGIPEYIALSHVLNRSMQFHDVSLSSLANSARHAVAIDERNRDFTPTLWDNLTELNLRRGADPTADDAPYQQVWFPGVHGAVGGGGERRGLANIALDWVWDGARRAGLEFDTSAGSPGAELKKDHRDALVSSTSAGLVRFVLDVLPEEDRNPGPGALHEVSGSARQRWKEDPSNLPESRPYRPPTLSRVADLLDET
jgi:uncharacterized protein (DUF2235 family)